MAPPSAVASNRYLADRVMTATPAQLIGMIYDVAVRSLDAARTAAIEGNRPQATHFILKAQDAVTELRCSLSPNGDAAVTDMATRLDAIYGYVFTRLVKASFGKTDSAIDECHRLLVQLRDAWRTGCLEGAGSTAAPVTSVAGVA
ncbi:MAG TPA: flagellar export chaperone FliS [Acidimicrobiales bacterium]|nr:flagellar export chaperone FliS [Acidimicrobiales bacterium]